MYTITAYFITDIGDEREKFREAKFVTGLFGNAKVKFSRLMEYLEWAFTLFKVTDKSKKSHFLFYYKGPEAYNSLRDKITIYKPTEKKLTIAQAIENSWKLQIRIKKQKENLSVEKFITSWLEYESRVTRLLLYHLCYLARERRLNCNLVKYKINNSNQIKE